MAIYRRTQPVILTLQTANIGVRVTGNNPNRIQFWSQLLTSGVNLYLSIQNPQVANPVSPLQGILLSSKGQTLADTPLDLPGCQPSLSVIYDGEWWAISDTAGTQLLWFEDTAV